MWYIQNEIMYIYFLFSIFSFIPAKAYRHAHIHWFIRSNLYQICSFNLDILNTSSAEQLILMKVNSVSRFLEHTETIHGSLRACYLGGIHMKMVTLGPGNWHWNDGVFTLACCSTSVFCTVTYGQDDSWIDFDAQSWPCLQRAATEAGTFLEPSVI